MAEVESPLIDELEPYSSVGSVDIVKGLKTLGFHPLQQRHCFLELSLPSTNLSDASQLSEYVNIMYLDVNNNLLTSLSPLQNMKCLVHLKASNNKLEKCLDFAPKHCHEASAWATGQQAVGSMLTLVDLSANLISNIGDLSSHRFLECLLLSRNQITQINGLNNLRFLQTLDLSNNKLTVIEGLDHLPIRELKLANNALTTLNGLEKMPCLTALDVANNRLQTLAALQNMRHLTFVDVSGNNLRLIRQVEFLVEMPWLHVLIMDHNPCALKEHYRLRVVFRLPNLQCLDVVQVTAEEKIKAHNLYRSPDGDLTMREAVFLEHVPTVLFEDYAPAQLAYDEEMEVSSEELVLGEPVPVTEVQQKEDAAMTTEVVALEPQDDDELEIVHVTTQ